MTVDKSSGEAGRRNRKITPIPHQLWNAAYCVTHALLAPFFRMNVMGAHFIPAEEGFILLPKHQCWQDIPLLGIAVGQPLYYVAKYELFRYPLIHWLARSLGGIPLNRERPIQTRWSFRAAVEVLEKGNGLVLFPEGTYFQNSMGSGRSGMMRFILNRVQVPLIPVGIKYTPNRRRQEVRIRFGAPIKFDGSPAVMDRVMGHIAVLSGLS